MRRIEHDLAEEAATAARARDLKVAAAESVTAGRVATALASAGSGSDWFSGSVVAYQTSLKQELLGVTTERVITAECATQMAIGCLRVTGADLAVAITGVGGPDPEEGRPAGTVFVCVADRHGSEVFEHAFAGDPEAVVDQATVAALQHLVDAARLPSPTAS